MQMQLVKTYDRISIDKLSVVRNFRQVIETRDISLMNKELYQFFTLYCGFIAHYNIDGFKDVYSSPKEFAEVFIRHFDSRHKYFNGIYPYHNETYRDTEYTKSEIKQEFFRITDLHKDSIGKWAEGMQRSERMNVYQILKQEFQGELKGLKINCEHCGNEYEVRVLKEGVEFNDFGTLCCLFCGQQIKLY
jgi:hypothetical protein